MDPLSWVYWMAIIAVKRKAGLPAEVAIRTKATALQECSPKQHTRPGERKRIFELREISKEEYERIKSIF